MIRVKAYSDIFVRYLLGDENNKDLLISFINAVNEDYDLPTISSVEIKNPYNLKSLALAKESIIDIRATDEKGHIYNIEIQTSGNNTYYNRSLYYWAKLYSSQLDEGEHYSLLKPTITINLLTFDLFPMDEIDTAHSCFVIKEQKRDKVLTNHLMLHFIELNKFVKENNFTTSFERWLAYFKFEGNKEEIMETLLESDKVIKKAHNRYNVFTKSDEMLELYEAREKWLKDKATEKYEAFEDGKLEGIIEGELKGKLEGKLEGIIEGELKGKLEGKLEAARKMKEEGVDLALIVRVTGLTKDEIMGL